MQGLQNLGYIPSDWVVILAKGLEEKEAFQMESGYRNAQGRPKFDRVCGEQNRFSKLTDKQAREIYIRAKNKELHKNIASDYGVCRTVVSMIATRKQWKAATACLV
jgi:hypothetical protein